MTDTGISHVVEGELGRQQVAATPLGRLASPADVTQMVGFYASEDNAVMTGTTVAINGGLSMY